MIKFMLLIIIIFFMINLESIVKKKKKILLSEKKDVKEYNKYLKIIDFFVMFLLTLLLFNVLFAKNLTIIPKISMILYSIILFFAILNIIIIFAFKNNDNLTDKKSKICNIFYYINILIMIILTFTDYIIYII